jgi:hypothetical protein
MTISVWIFYLRNTVGRIAVVLTVSLTNKIKKNLCVMQSFIPKNLVKYKVSCPKAFRDMKFHIQKPPSGLTVNCYNYT